MFSITCYNSNIRVHVCNIVVRVFSDCDGMDCPEVWARIAVLNGQTQAAEVLYLEQNQVEKAIKMYLSLHKWENGNSNKLT